MNLTLNMIESDLYYLENKNLIKTLRMVKRLMGPSYADIKQYCEFKTMDEVVDRLNYLYGMYAIKTVGIAEVKITHYGLLLLAIVDNEIEIKGVDKNEGKD